MKTIWIKLFGLVFLSVFLSGPALAATVTLKDDAPSSMSSREINVTSKGIKFDLEERPLADVLRWIQKESGIRFEVSEGLLEESIRARFLSPPDWTVAIRMLLRDFNKVELWDDDNHLTRVRILGSGTSESKIIRSSKYRSSDLKAPPGAKPNQDRSMDGPPQSSSRFDKNPGTSSTPPGMNESRKHHPGPPISK